MDDPPGPSAAHWPARWFYEYLKDVRSYALILGVILACGSPMDSSTFSGCLTVSSLVQLTEPMSQRPSVAPRMARIERNIAVGRGRASAWPWTASSGMKPCFA